jgi:hypothetical protein
VWDGFGYDARFRVRVLGAMVNLNGKDGIRFRRTGTTLYAFYKPF